MIDFVIEVQSLQLLVDSLGKVGAIRPKLFARIIWIKQGDEFLTVVHSSMGGFIVAYQLMLAVRVDMIL